MLNNIAVAPLLSFRTYVRNLNKFYCNHNLTLQSFGFVFSKNFANIYIFFQLAIKLCTN